MTDFEQDEICRAVEQSSGGLILRNWMETRALFLQYILKSKSSCVKSIADMFARDEYRQDKGNLSHIHAMIRLNWDEINTDDRMPFIEDLVRASVVDLVRSD